MLNYLNESYWKENFCVTPIDIDQLYEYLVKRNEPLSTDEIGETVVRNFVERGGKKPNIRIYSPERKYKVNEEIFILQKGVKKYARITDIVPNKCTFISSKEIQFDMIRVQFLDIFDTARYVSNCPDFPLRFQEITKRQSHMTLPFG